MVTVDIACAAKLSMVRMDFDEWLSPHSADIFEALRRYFNQCRLYEQLGLPQKQLLKAHSLVNDYMFPRGEHGQLLSTGLMMTYFFLFDYIYDVDINQEKYIKNIRDNLSQNLLLILNGQTLDKDNCCDFLKSIQEILGHFETTPDDWRGLFILELKKYIQATIRGKIYVRKYPKLSLSNYLKLREQDCGGWWSAYLIEYVHDLYLSPEERSQSDLVRLTRLCLWICSLINDLFSFPKERESEECPFNAVFFCMNYYQISERFAVDFLIKQLNQLLAEFKLLSTKEIFQSSTAITSYTQGLKEFVSGIWYWHHKSNLYPHSQALLIDSQVSRVSQRLA